LLFFNFIEMHSFANADHYTICFTDPDVVTSLCGSNKTTSSVSLTWNAPPGNSSLFIINWTDGSVSNSSNTSELSYIVTGLAAGVNYTFSVTAVAADGQTTGATTQVSAFTKPDVTSDLSVTEITASSLFLNWTEPIGERSFFKVQWSDGSITLNSTTSNTSFNITDLNPGVSYTCLISAVAADHLKEGEAIGLSAYTKPDTVSNLTVVNVTTSSILLSWTQSMEKISHYVIQYENNSTTINNTAESAMINITDLTPGVQYTFRVFAVAGDNKTEGNYSCISAYTKPEVASDLSVTEITTSSLFLNWTEPIGERSFFKVQWSNGSITLNSTTSNTSFNITDLNPGVSYTFLISAVAADNITEGEAIGLSAYTKPDTVSNLTVVNVTASSILLSWTQSSGKILYYVIQYENNSTTINNTAESTMINITDLTPGVLYTFRVFAVAEDNKKTKGSSICISAYTKPPVPSFPDDVEIVVTPMSQSVITLEFSDRLLNNTNAPIQAYGVLLSTDPNSNISSNFLTMTYNDYLQGNTNTYLTVLKLNDDSITRSNMIKIEIGSNNDAYITGNTDYENGPLTNQEYRMALVLFTYMKIEDRLVDIQQSVFSVAPFASITGKPSDPKSNTAPIVLAVLLPIISSLLIIIIIIIICHLRSDRFQLHHNSGQDKAVTE
ncbi:receptor-type tyrosine-protein phosphatase eta-like, partial [Clarias magur]